jgi:hypothetical protein
MSFDTFDAAKEYAINGGEPVNIMFDPKTQKYHVIREFGVEHWEQHYENLAEVRFPAQVTTLVDES